MGLFEITVAGAAGAFVKELSQKGVEWLVSLVTAQSPAVKAKMNKNAENFFRHLAQRVERLEGELSAEKKHLFEDAINHPGTSFLMKKALLAAAVTENDDRHQILSELIAQRLAANEDDMIALVGGAACDIVHALSSRHLRLLGVMAILFDIRPAVPLEAKTQEEYDRVAVSWWNEHLDILCTSELMKTHGIDFRHLVGLSCISLSIGSKDMKKILALPQRSSTFSSQLEKLQSFPWWAPLKHIWDLGGKSANTTSIGALIGTLFHDQAVRKPTIIQWDAEKAMGN